MRPNTDCREERRAQCDGTSARVDTETGLSPEMTRANKRGSRRGGSPPPLQTRHPECDGVVTAAAVAMVGQERKSKERKE